MYASPIKKRFFKHNLTEPSHSFPHLQPKYSESTRRFITRLGQISSPLLKISEGKSITEHGSSGDLGSNFMYRKNFAKMMN